MKSKLTLEKFNKRLEQVRQAKHASFQESLREFWDFFDEDPFLTKIRQNAVIQIPNLQDLVQQRMGGSTATENLSKPYQNAITIELLRTLADFEFGNFRGAVKRCILPREFSFYGNQNDLDNSEIEVFKSIYLNRLANYVETELETTIEDELNRSEVFNQLLRYKHRSEWFEYQRLFQIYEKETDENTRKAEKMLASDLYAYLYDHGIEFHIEPKSVKGSVDLISAQKDNRLLADTKIFDGKSRGKAYICSGFVQVYSYSKQYNEAVAYLIIYNVSATDLEINLPHDENELAYFEYNGKRFYFIVIDIYPNSIPASKRKNLKSIEINLIDLVNKIDNSES